MKIKLLAIVSIIVFLGIMQGCTTQVCGCFHPTNIDIALSYEDQAGNDLLNPEHANALTEDNLDVYYRKEERYKDKLNFTESFQIVKEEDKNNFLLLELSSAPFKDGRASILIDFPHSSSDTLEIQAKGSNPLYASKVWYKGELVWTKAEQGQSQRRYFEITKTMEAN